jgi:hypothetical protein
MRLLAAARKIFRIRNKPPQASTAKEPQGSTNTPNIPLASMNRIASALVLASVALMAASCCCTSDSKPPKLRPLPQFQEIQGEAPAAPQVHYAK